MKFRDVLVGGVIAALLSFVVFFSPAQASECGVKGSIQQMREQIEQFVAQGNTGSVVEMNDDLIKAVTDKIGHPPQEDIKKWYLLTAENIAAIAITDSHDCIRTTVGPMPKQVIYSILGMSEASN
jgi:hypothetical protein